MSHIRTKIKYNSEGSYGSTEEHTLYCHHNNCCDVVTFYYEDGDSIFSFEDTLDGNIFDKMVEIIHNWDPEKNPNVKYQDEEDENKIRNYVPPAEWKRYSESEMQFLLEEQRKICFKNIEENNKIGLTSEGVDEIRKTIIEKSEIKNFDEILKK